MGRYISIFVRIISSTWVTVALVTAFILLSIAGAMLPQVGATVPAAVEAWKAAHPLITALAAPLGLFAAFSSVPFMVLLAAFAVNMVACTTRRMLRARGARGAAAVAVGGSLLLHIGLLAILAGGVVTAGTSVDGRIVATEGQAIDLSAEEQYLGLNRGVWAGDDLPGYVVAVESSRSVNEAGVATQIETMLSIAGPETPTVSRELAVNSPVRLEGAVLTHADWGYSPLLTVVSPQGEVVVDAYVALASVHGGGVGAYQDVVEAPGLPDVVRMTLLPDLRFRDGVAVSASLEPSNPAVVIETLGEDGSVVESGVAALGSQVAVGGYNFAFGDLRRWTAVRVRADSGRFVVYAGFVIGLLGLLIRYAPASWTAVRGRRSPSDEVNA